MKGPSLQRSAALSAGLHITFFLLSFLVLRQSRNIVMPSPYVVSLVAPGSTVSRASTAPLAEAARAGEEMSSAKGVEKKEAKARVDEKSEQKLIDESISEIQAKKKIQRLARLRALVSVQGRGGQSSVKPSARATPAGAPQGSGEGSYIDKVAGEIHNEWQWPDYMKKDLEAIISIRILKDGTISQMKFEKKSGDRLFDRSVAQAIAKASPVAPPPYEMEIGVRFYP